MTIGVRASLKPQRETDPLPNKGEGMQETLGRRITIGYGIGLVLLGMVAVAAYRSITQSLEETRWVAHTHAVLERLTSVLLQSAV